MKNWKKHLEKICQSQLNQQEQGGLLITIILEALWSIHDPPWPTQQIILSSPWTHVKELANNDSSSEKRQQTKGFLH